MTPGAERDMINNQKRIIRELKRIGDALEKLAGTDGGKSIADYISGVTGTKDENHEASA